MSILVNVIKIRLFLTFFFFCFLATNSADLGNCEAENAKLRNATTPATPTNTTQTPAPTQSTAPTQPTQPPAPTQPTQPPSGNVTTKPPGVQVINE